MMVNKDTVMFAHEYDVQTRTLHLENIDPPLFISRTVSQAYEVKP